MIVSPFIAYIVGPGNCPFTVKMSLVLQSLVYEASLTCDQLKVHHQPHPKRNITCMNSCIDPFMQVYNHLKIDSMHELLNDTRVRGPTMENESHTTP